MNNDRYLEIREKSDNYCPSEFPINPVVQWLGTARVNILRLPRTRQRLGL